MNDDLKKQLEEIEQRGNYLEMDNVLIANQALASNDVDYAIYELKCIVHGGMSIGKNLMLEPILRKTTRSKKNDLLSRMGTNMGNRVLDIGIDGILALTNSYFIMAIKTTITYGSSDNIDQAAKLICPLYSPIREMLKHKGSIDFKTYCVVAALMCNVGNTIADSVIQTNKANLPGAKNIVSGFVESVMAPLKSMISGLAGLAAGSNIPGEIRNKVKGTYKKMVSMA